MLPYPLENCVTYPILLPRISCTQVEEKKCMAVPRVSEGLLLTVNKCLVTFGDLECSESVLTLPRQGCPLLELRARSLYLILKASDRSRENLKHQKFFPTPFILDIQ